MTTPNPAPFDDDPTDMRAMLASIVSQMDEDYHNRREELEELLRYICLKHEVSIEVKV